jgi:hypothetical protein
MDTAFIVTPMPKTGSSYIRANLSLNKENLLSEGINYPESELDEKEKKGGITTGDDLFLVTRESIKTILKAASEYNNKPDYNTES